MPPDAPEFVLPFWYWSLVFFVFGAIFGSLANVCIHRMPLGQSIVTPRSHCPKCGYMIPWHQNIPLWSWVRLRGQCANCGLRISARYFLVELLTGVAFLSCWVAFGPYSTAVAAAFCVLLFGFIIATFIDIEHFIIPDEITIGGMVAGFLISGAVPLLHGTTSRPGALLASALGLAVGGGLVYAILRLGKLLFGRRHIKLEPGSRLTFTETDLHLPDEVVPYEDIFYRRSDTIILHARRLELVDRCYTDVPVRLSPAALKIGGETFVPDSVPFMEVTTDHFVRPQEAMGFGDVKFMAAIGAFLGWHAVIFSLTLSAVLGSVVGLAAISLRKREWSSRIPYGPYIAVAATVWIFYGPEVTMWWLNLWPNMLGLPPIPPGGPPA
jgi:leader peptidase (prepilin peptidase) / N-methyltransferase